MGTSSKRSGIGTLSIAALLTVTALASTPAYAISTGCTNAPNNPNDIGVQGLSFSQGYAGYNVTLSLEAGEVLTFNYSGPSPFEVFVDSAPFNARSATPRTFTYTVTSTGNHRFGLYTYSSATSTLTVTCSALVAPAVTGLAPATGPTAGGTSVVITGTDLNGATAVTFGGTPATGFTINSATRITATTPAKSAGVADVIVTTPGGVSANTAADNFTFQAPAPVPTLSEWAMILFGLILAGVAALYIQRRQMAV